MSNNESPLSHARIEEGKLVRFRQTLRSPLFKKWGMFEYTAIYPDYIGTRIKDKIKYLSTHDKTRFLLDISQKDYFESLVIEVDKKNLSGSNNLKQGMIFSANINGNRHLAVIKNIKKDIIMLDLNHPMSGQKDIEAEIEIMEVRSPSDSELSYFLKRKAPLVTIV
jgi:hypothetical protein